MMICAASRGAIAKTEVHAVCIQRWLACHFQDNNYVKVLAVPYGLTTRDCTYADKL